ncbi:MAG: WbqC family protein [Mariprofundaceae bacterium]|nr:WbqC family protein [Mariprofundaceae bacterium]
MVSVSIHQPNYMPWSGFFHKWLSSDHFVLLDNVQYHKNEWQNRNQIKTSQGKQWITVPVTYRFPQRIEEVNIVANTWAKKQIASIEQAYSKAPFFHDYWLPIHVILSEPHDKLSDLNISLIRCLGQLLGCTAPLHVASDLPMFSTEATPRLMDICQHLQADVYHSGAEGRSYLQQDVFVNAGLGLRFQDISPVSYPQLHGEFVPYLSVLDVLFNLGEDAPSRIRSMGGWVL